MPIGDLFSLEPLPAVAVPSRKRRLVLITCVYATAIALVLVAQLAVNDLATDQIDAQAPATSQAMSAAPTQY